MGSGLRTVLRATAALAVGWMLVAGCSESERKPPRRSVSVAVGMELERASRALKQGHLSSALIACEKAGEVDSLVPDIFYLQGQVYSRLYAFDESDAAFRKAVALDPSFEGAWYQIGQNAFLQTSYRRAIDAYRKELNVLGSGREDEEATIHLQIGRAYAFALKLDSAKAAYAHALALQPGSAQGHAWLAEVLRKDGAFEEALAEAKRARALDSTNAENNFVLGALLVQTGRAEAAMGPLHDALRRQPWHEGAVYNLGRALLAVGREEEGRAYLARTDSLQWLRLAIGSARKETMARAGDPEQWRRLADLLVQSRRFDEAREAYLVAQTLARNAAPGR